MNMPPLNKFKRFFVRALVQSGGEQFPEIHKCVPALGLDEGLIVVATFLPPPLVEKLAGDGYASKVERGTGRDWLVYFWHKAA